jgi:uncharacterized protein YkwD
MMLAVAVASSVAGPLSPAKAASRVAHASRGPRACAGASLAPASGEQLAVERATLCLINQIRVAHRLSVLRANTTLTAVAASQVTTMLELDYFADLRPGGQTPLALVGQTRYARRARVSVGQNIAWGTGIEDRAEAIVTAWMQSPPHRRIILTSGYRDAGVAVTAAVPAVLGATDGEAATYVVEFGVRRP